MIATEEHRLFLDGAPIRDARRRARRAKAADPLAERMRLVGLWRSCPWPHSEPMAWTLYRQAGFRWTLMPGVRRLLEARESARKAAYAAALNERCRRWELTKALRKAAPLPLLEGAV